MNWKIEKYCHYWSLLLYTVVATNILTYKFHFTLHCLRPYADKWLKKKKCSYILLDVFCTHLRRLFTNYPYLYNYSYVTESFNFNNNNSIYQGSTHMHIENIESLEELCVYGTNNQVICIHCFIITLDTGHILLLKYNLCFP